MRFTRLVKAIECGTPIEKNGTPSLGGSEKISEVSKKRRKRVVEGDDSAMNQNTLLKTDQPNSNVGEFADDSDGGKMALGDALGDKADDIPAAKKFTSPPTKKVAINKSRIGINSDSASLGMSTSKPVGSESEPHSSKVGGT